MTFQRQWEYVFNSLLDEELEGEDEIDEEELESQVEHTDDKESPETVEVEEDIYGRPKVKGNAQVALSSYIPPHLRRLQEDSTTEKDSQSSRELIRRLNGQLNRMSENNMEYVHFFLTLPLLWLLTRKIFVEQFVWKLKVSIAQMFDQK